MRRGLRERRGPRETQGKTGVQGPQGTQGKTGAQGAQGAKGAQGSEGAKGAQGAQGSQGKAGLPGAKGKTGAQGKAGPQGSPGTTGAQGAKGAQGQQGPQGAQGAPGQPAGWFAYDTGSQNLPNSATTVVATLAPIATGHYHVNGLANLSLGADHWAECWLDTVTSLGSKLSATPVAANRQASARLVPVAETGSIFVPHSGVIQELCATNEGGASSDRVQQTAITATAVDNSIQLGSARPKTRTAKHPHNDFTPRSEVKADGA